MSGYGSEKKQGRSELVARVAAGDSRAQQELVRHLQRRIRMIALAILGNAHDAEDATQVIMMEVLRSARSFRGESLLGWADRIAARTAARQARQRRAFATRRDRGGYVDHARLQHFEPAFPEEGLVKPLVEYLAELSEVRRVTLVLRHVLGYSVEEIAELTGSSPNTVKDRLLQGRAQMRRSIRRDRVARGR